MTHLSLITQTPSSERAEDTLTTPNGHPITPGTIYLFTDLNDSWPSGLVTVTRVNTDEALITCLRLDLDTETTDTRTLTAIPEELEGPMPSPEAIHAQAKELFHKDGELEIDDDATLTMNADGLCKLSCWVWVSDDACGITETDKLTNEERSQAYLSAAKHTGTCAFFDAESTVSLGDDAGAYVSGWVTFTAKPPLPTSINASEILARAPCASESLHTLNVPEFFKDPAFLNWLNSESTTVFTWHTKGQPAGEWSDVIVSLEGSCNGEGDASDMPEYLWNLLVDYCKAQFGERPSARYYLKLTNLG